MKTAIVYVSKHGTTGKICNEIAKYVVGDKCMINLDSNQHPDLSSFDVVILGQPIYGGQRNATMRQFYNNYRSLLLSKRLGLFVSGLTPKEEDQKRELVNAFPEDIFQRASVRAFLGGAVHFDKLNFTERTIVKMIMKSDEDVENINYTAIKQFAQNLYENDTV